MLELECVDEVDEFDDENEDEDEDEDEEGTPPEKNKK